MSIRDLAIANKLSGDSNVTKLVDAFAAKRSPVSRADLREVLRNINVDLAVRILGVKAPRVWMEPDPDDIRDIATYMLAVAKECDAWSAEIGRLISASKDGMKEFTDPFVKAIDGNATHVIEELAREIDETHRR